METDTTIRSPQENEHKLWDSFIKHPLQSWAWGEFRTSMGIQVIRCIEEKQNKIVSVWQFSIHPIPHTPWTIGYLPKGPTPSASMLHHLRTLGKKHNCIFIQLEPNMLENNQTISLPSSHHPLFTKYTFVLDLTKSETQLLADMHSKTRYNIKIAQKKGVTIQEENTPEAFAEYLHLQEETMNRQGFYAHNRQYHEQMWKQLHPAGIAHLWTARFEGNVLAAWILFYWNNTIYYPYGTSSRDHREVMAPNLLLWEIAVWGRKHEFTAFDLWGAMGPNPDTKDPWYGFHRFKEGYNPIAITFTGSHDVIIKPQLYRLYCLADTIRWKWLHARK